MPALLLFLLALSPFPRGGSSEGVGEAPPSGLLRLGASGRSAPLRFSAASTFKVALFADLHYGENAWTGWGPAQDDNSDRVMATVLDAESPDLVIYLGDVITANNLPVANASLYWDRAISAARSRGIPWVTVFGNHDDAPFEWPPEWFSDTGIPERTCPAGNSSRSPDQDVGEDCRFGGTSRAELMAKEIGENALSFSSSGPVELWPSVSNYVLPVFSPKKDDDPAESAAVLLLLLYFLDSGGGTYPEVISNAQVRWFEQKSGEMNPDSTIPEVIFWHIPSRAYTSVAPSRIFGIRRPCVGSINKESVAPQQAEWGMMEILSRRPSVKAVFAGHNHGLDWCCPRRTGPRTLWLCFARHTGYGGYGDWPRGARIVEMAASEPELPFSVASWIRMEDASLHSYINLTGTASDR